MAVNDELGVFLNTGILAARAHDLGRLIQHQENILTQFLDAGFVPKACAAILANELDRYPYLTGLFDVASVAAGGCIASQALLYDFHQDRGLWSFACSQAGSELAAQSIQAGDIEQVGAGLRHALQKNDWQLLAEQLGAPRLLECSHTDVGAPLAWPAFDGPGIQRLEHASLLISSETTRLLIDPISLAIGGNVGLPDLDLAPSNLAYPVDGILVSHGHLDHWHIPTILRHGGDGSVPVIVPHIPVASLLSQDDMRQSLADVGQTVMAPAWGDTVHIGDIAIDILPFYGEQPTIGASSAPYGVRNWGNCYRVTTPQFSVILLVDSGSDAMGSVMDVLERSLEKRGPPDLLLSCCREMTKAPFWQGLFTFWLTLPMTELQKLAKQQVEKSLASITLGPDGIAEACLRFGIGKFAPYANGFCGIGKAIHDIGWGNDEPSEAEVVQRICTRIDEAGGKTEVVAWLPGDVIRFADGKARIGTIAERGGRYD
ncbi:MBL fold metallo-hydrolase [Chromobacterium amazonense]|uniref:MBL fold metallo-hydrolase n=1 Tax=Chromobacterium amazonense TaxID=1382803 RepID=UPI00237E04F7|nr:MBL fold metallo-hydrolase [Chromobacterium amazonense]MDE1715947.1 MBL fold metallo-hydrolase [Chromobacterium amazonense]